MDLSLNEKIKAVGLDLLKNFIKICESYELNYILVGGSCLGAVRHNGFIPWDDDIDVALLRKDYERFLKIAQNELPDYIFLQTAFTDKEYPLNFAKLRNLNTTFIETAVSKFNINHGMYLDIFPIDGFPNNRFARKIRNLTDSFYSIRINSEYYYEEAPVWSVKERLIKAVSKILYPNYKTAVFKRDELLKKYSCDSCAELANYCGVWGEKEIMQSDIFLQTTDAIFEGITVKIPQNYDAYLTKIYGDYMTPPPPEKQISHHFCTKIDAECSFKEY